MIGKVLKVTQLENVGVESNHRSPLPFTGWLFIPFRFRFCLHFNRAPSNGQLRFSVSLWTLWVLLFPNPRSEAGALLLRERESGTDLPSPPSLLPQKQTRFGATA